VGNYNIAYSVIVVKFGVNNGSGSDTGCFEMKARMDRTKLKYSIKAKFGRTRYQKSQINLPAVLLSHNDCGQVVQM